MAACPVCGAQNALAARFCSTCGIRLGPAAPSRETRKTVTVLFADVTGSTALGEQLDPESLRALMTRYFAEMKTIIERHGGTVEKFIGDAVMAVFGIPAVHEDDALRAVRAAAEIRDRLAELNLELSAERGLVIRFRTGLYTGEVVAGDPATGPTLATGDTVNTAARLEQAAPPGEILIGVPTYRLVRDAVTVEPVEAVSAKGKAEPVPAYRLVSVAAAGEGHMRRFDRPIVGREDELAALRAAFDLAVTEHSPRLVTILGNAGVGKSRLVAEFRGTLDRSTQVLAGTCLSYGEGITYWPLREVVNAAAGINETDDAAAARAKLDSILADELDGAMMAGHLAAAIGLSNSAVLGDEIPWAAGKLLETLARKAPLIVIWDDLHRAEPAFLDLVEHVAELTRDLPILLLCMARPEVLDERPSWGGGRLNATTIRLEPLGSETAEALLAGLPGGSALPGQLRGRISAAAEGNPLYLEELLGMLVDEGRLVQVADGRWTTAGDLAHVVVPPTIRALVASRLELLPQAERTLAERASVVGRVFETSAVRELTPELEQPDLTTRLLSLVRKDLIGFSSDPGIGGDDAYRFRHLLLRDVAYEVLPKGERAALHERFADWLEDVSGDRSAEYAEVLAHHLEQARQYRMQLGQTGAGIAQLANRAADALLRAGTRAYERGDQKSAAEALAAAWSIPGRSRDQAADIFARYCAALRSERRLAELKDLVETSRVWAREGDDRLAAWHRLQSLLLAADRVGPEKDTAALKRLDARFASLNDDFGRALTLQLLGAALTRQGALAEAVKVTREGIAAAARAGSREREMRLQVNLLDCLFVGPNPLPDTEREILSLLERPDLPRQHRAFVSSYLADARAMRGDIDGARRTYDESIAVCQDVDRTSAPVLLIALADLEMRVGDVARARELLLPMAEDVPAQSVQWASAAGVLAVSSARLGYLAEARGWIESAGEGHALEDRALLLRAESLVAAGFQHQVDALRYAEASLAAALDANRLLLQADALRHLGELGRSFHEADADGHLEAALRLYESKGDLVSAERVRAALEAPAGAPDAVVSMGRDSRD